MYEKTMKKVWNCGVSHSSVLQGCCPKRKRLMWSQYSVTPHDPILSLGTNLDKRTIRQMSPFYTKKYPLLHNSIKYNKNSEWKSVAGKLFPKKVHHSYEPCPNFIECPIFIEFHHKYQLRHFPKYLNSYLQQLLKLLSFLLEW